MMRTARRRRIDADLAARARWAAARWGVLHADLRRTLSGFGELLPVELPSLAQVARDPSLAAHVAEIPVEGAPGPIDSLPRAHVAFPFDPTSTPSAVVPSLQVTESEGGTWLVTVADEDGEHDALVDLVFELLPTIAPPAIDTAVDVIAVHERPTATDYEAAVAEAVAEISSGALRKVVLARTAELEAAADLDPAAVLQRMAEREPTCTRYAFPGPDGGRLVGASPELLISREDDQVASHPLAGTVSLEVAGADAGSLLRSRKDLDEHRLVVEDLAYNLRPLLESLEVPPGPSLVRLRSVAHLGTELRGQSASTTSPHLLALLAALHPTPAVGGVPTEVAIALIDRLEGARPNYFAGGLGWCNAAGAGHWVLAIRGALLEGPRCSVTAGAGIVADSTPSGEAAETRSKLASVLEAVAPGSGALLEVVS
jgi:isochorismate synthase